MREKTQMTKVRSEMGAITTDLSDSKSNVREYSEQLYAKKLIYIKSTTSYKDTNYQN